VPVLKEPGLAAPVSIAAGEEDGFYIFIEI
jgi:hypothetical protein